MTPPENTRPPSSGLGPALLAGLIRCAFCGHVMTRTSVNACGTFTYLCPGRHSGEACPARASIRGRLIEEHVGVIARAELERLHVEAAASDAVAVAARALDDAESELDAYLDAVSAAELAPTPFRAGAQRRHAKIESAKDLLHAELARRPQAPSAGSGAEVWDGLSVSDQNTLLRSLLAAVIVPPAGRIGGGIPATERARVVAFGVELGLAPDRGHRAKGICPLFPDADDEGVLSAPPREDALEASGSAS